MASAESGDGGNALDVFAAWLSRREKGEQVEFEELLRGHPHLAAELMKLEATWRGLAEANDPSDAVPSLREWSKSSFERDSVPGAALRAQGNGWDREDSAAALIVQLSAHRKGFGRYRLRGELARGGMGAILKIWDEDLRRHLAMKVILGQAEASASGATPPVKASQVARFLEEAQVTAQLDHPGIVPVHELGLDPEGRLYFTMKLVKGRSLKEVFDLLEEGKEGWTRTRALGVLLKVCEAMAYAHDKGVIHRDLKPANIMVGRFGEVHVMDWGLARIVDQPDSRDLRIRERADASELHDERGERKESRSEMPGSPLYTMDGDVVGTPAYMSPEQAAGRTGELGPHSDVYALGAMLYHLLAGQMPYVLKSVHLDNHAIWRRVQQGPPASIAQLSSETPTELVAICEKAMARDWRQRYRNMSELAEDLSAYLEHRVVGALERGTWAEAKKWVERNKALAASIAAAIVVLVAGLATSLAYRSRAELEALGKTTQALIATEKSNDVLLLSTIEELKELIDRADALWPAYLERLPEFERWIADAKVLIDGCAADPARGIAPHPSLKDLEAKLAEIRSRAKPSRGNGTERQADKQQTLEFENPQDRSWNERLSKLVSDLHAFTDERAGGLFSSGTSPMHGCGLIMRAAFARTIAERSVDGPEARARWDEAITAIARSPKYRGLTITPQLGLLPIGEDPDSNLWEFAHLQTGEAASRDARGKLILKSETGLVLVLIPGGTCWIGAQDVDPNAVNYDPFAADNESPTHEVTLRPYFLSKYEMTQAQWRRISGSNPSSDRSNDELAELHPVQQVSWNECDQLVRRLGLTLPTEAQWEHGCRAGSQSTWSAGDHVESLDGFANIADEGSRSAFSSRWDFEAGFRDGYAREAPVGSLKPNSFGLHDMHGNVYEWCRDRFGPYRDRFGSGDGENQSGNPRYRVYRGGSFFDPARYARSAHRDGNTVDHRDGDIGLRPAKSLTK